MDFGSKDIYFFPPFSLCVSVYVYAPVCDFVCIALLLPFILGFCLSVFFFLLLLKKIFFLIIIFHFNNFIFFLSFFLSFLLSVLPPSFLPPFLSFFLSFLSFFPFFLPSHVDERLLLLQPGIRAVPLRWESQVQDTGSQETSQLHIITNGKKLPEITISTPRPSFTQ